MDILLRQATVIDPTSPFHQQRVDILIQNGIIAAIGTIDNKKGNEINIENLYVSRGWTDIFSNFCDPGFEFKETIETGAAAAAAGGFTGVFVIPNTSPTLHNKGSVEYIVQKSKTLPVDVYPIGAVTRNTDGKELAEMYDMAASGAIAFSDGLNTIQSSGLLLKALQYLKAIDKTIIQVPDDKTITAHGFMNEGMVSTRLGLQGKPAIAEEIMIRRDIELAKYAESKIHFSGISTAESIRLIADAKNKGIKVTCSVTPYHLFFTDEDLQHYNTYFKVNPPLRTREDVEALKEGILNGTVDCIASHHLPQDKDHKLIEFEYAENGMLSLETAFAMVRTAIPELSIDRLVQLFTAANELFSLSSPSVAIDQKAKLSLFTIEQQWTVNSFRSKSDNSPLTGKVLTGKPIGIINQDKVFLNH